ncbi:hypothetical protein GALL_284760 [mine drainage metagenome]|uniref:Uncharacterized protein n=1 Tax=mine drainage metagenome TaxID=410659 RepID=A0A1J5RND5_9ZZZZ
MSTPGGAEPPRGGGGPNAGDPALDDPEHQYAGLEVLLGRDDAARQITPGKQRFLQSLDEDGDAAAAQAPAGGRVVSLHTRQGAMQGSGRQHALQPDLIDAHAGGFDGQACLWSWCVLTIRSHPGPWLELFSQFVPLTVLMLQLRDHVGRNRQCRPVAGKDAPRRDSDGDGDGCADR